MSFSIQNFLEVLAVCGGMAFFSRIFFDVLDSRDRVLQGVLVVVLVLAFLSSFVRWE